MFMVICVIVRVDSMSMSFLGVGVLVAMAVRMTTGPMAVSHVVEEYETNEVRSEAERADDEDEFGLRYFLGFNESLDGFEENGET